MNYDQASQAIRSITRDLDAEQAMDILHAAHDNGASRVNRSGVTVRFDGRSYSITEFLGRQVMDVVSGLTGLDEGTLTEDEETELFQHLVNTGLAWQLQGRIGRQAAAMINVGLIAAAGEGEGSR